MRFISCPGCQRIAWDGPHLYAATRGGEYFRLLPEVERLFSPTAPDTVWRTDHFEAHDGCLLVDRVWADRNATGNAVQGGVGPSLFVLAPDLTPPVRFQAGDSVWAAMMTNRRRGAVSMALVLADGQHLLSLEEHGLSIFDCQRMSSTVCRVFAAYNGEMFTGPVGYRVTQLERDAVGEIVAVSVGGSLSTISITENVMVMSNTAVTRHDPDVGGCCALTADRILYRMREHASMLVDRRTNETLVRTDRRVRSLSPDGRWAGELATPGADFRLLDGATLQVRHEFRFAAKRARFSPDGLTVALVEEGGVRLIDLD